MKDYDAGKIFEQRDIYLTETSSGVGVFFLKQDISPGHFETYALLPPKRQTTVVDYATDAVIVSQRKNKRQLPLFGRPGRNTVSC